MKNTKFVVKVNRGGAHVPVYVCRIDRTPTQTTTSRKLALDLPPLFAHGIIRHFPIPGWRLRRAEPTRQSRPQPPSLL